MFFLKKFVGIGSGKAAHDEAIDNEQSRSRSETPSEETGSNNNEEDVKGVAKVTKKKRGRSSRSMRKGKTEKRRVEAEDKEKEDFSESSPKIVVAEEDPSETDRSQKEENSTSQDISSADLSSENSPEKIVEEVVPDKRKENALESVESGVQKVNEDEEIGNETVNFDDFWADFDEHEGKPRKKSEESVGQGEQIVEDVVEEVSEKVASEKTNLDDFWGDIDEQDNMPRKKIEDSVGEEQIVKDAAEEVSGAVATESGNSDDFWGNLGEQDSFPRRKIEESVDEDQIAKEVVGVSEEASPEKERLEDSEKEKTVDDLEQFWADKEDDLPPIVKVKLLDDEKEDFENVDDDKKDGSENNEALEPLFKSKVATQSERLAVRMSSSPEAEKIQDKSPLRRSESVEGEESEKITSKSDPKELGAGSKKGQTGSDDDDDKSGPPSRTEAESWITGRESGSPEATVDDATSKLQSESDGDSESVHGSKTEAGDTWATDYAESVADDRDTSKRQSEAEDKERSPPQATEEILAPSANAEESSIDNFWGDVADDIPPVFELKKLSLSEDYSKEETSPVSDGPTKEEASPVSEDSSKEAEAAREGVKEEDDDTSSSKEQSGETSENTNSATVSSEQTTETEKQEADIPAPAKDDEASEDAKHIKEFHKRNFAKALKDIEQPTRRRSVLPCDNRERVLQDERVRQLSESSSGRPHRVSESSADGETSEDDGIMDFLGKETNRAEARLAARRQARVEAREIRMRELERVQKEQEENSDKVLEFHGTPRQNALSSTMSPRERPMSNNSYHSSRRSSEDSMEDGLSLRDIRHDLKEVEEKFRKAMIANAQLDNEKAALAYQVELLKDKLEELEEAHSQLGREHRERCREHEALKRAAAKLKEDLNACAMMLEERDRLIADYGLVIVGGDIDEKGELTPRALISAQSAEFLETAGEGSLDVRLKTLAKEKNDLLDEVRHLKLDLEEERNRRRNDKMLSNGPVGDEVQQTLNDYRFRLQKSEQDTNTLQATVARLESQVFRYKSAAEISEKAEDELKVEKRKLQRENRESIARIEELETANSHLQRRMDKLKNAKSTLLKEL